MLDANDIAILKGMFDAQRKDIIVEMTDKMHSFITASEKRTDIKLQALRKNIYNDFAEILDIHVLTPIAQLQSDMAMVKNHLKLT